jgi:hypothetical protein
MRPLKVLYVDDEADIRDVAALAVELRHRTSLVDARCSRW